VRAGRAKWQQKHAKRDGQAMSECVHCGERIVATVTR
jgi:hypothetical protein